MVKGVIRFVLTTLLLAALGIVLTILGATVGKSNPALQPIAIFGVLLLLCSPIISAFWIWHKISKASRMAREDADAEQKRIQSQEEEQKRNDFLRHRFLERQRLIDSVDRHRAALKRNLDRAITRNDYGVIVADLTIDALLEFFASIDLDKQAVPIAEASELVFEQLDFRKMEERATGFRSDDIPFDGHAFETWVADALRGFGWEAEVTPGSGDQGIDVIAMKNGKKLGLQCKLYSSPVGNKAVQEAHAGKVYYGADAAGVLTNAGFTASARDLAAVTGVMLFSHHEIPELFEKTFRSA